MYRPLAEWAAAALAGLGLCSLVLAALSHRFGGRRLCPGPCSARILRPLRLFAPSRCNYDLSGISDSPRSHTCPECGREVATPEQVRRSCWTPRFRFTGAWCVLLSFVAAAAPSLWSSPWPTYLPTTVLIAWEHLPYSWRPYRCRAELEARTDRQQLSHPRHAPGPALRWSPRERGPRDGHPRRPRRRRRPGP